MLLMPKGGRYVAAGGGGFTPRYTDSIHVSGGETDFTHTVAWAKTGATVGNNLLVSVHWDTFGAGTMTSVGLAGDTAVTTPAITMRPDVFGSPGSNRVSQYLVPITSTPGDLEIITGGGADVAIISVDIYEIPSSFTLQDDTGTTGYTSGTSVTVSVTDVLDGITVGYSWSSSGDTPCVITGVPEPTADADSNAYTAGNGGYGDRGTTGFAIGTGANSRSISSTGADTGRFAVASVWA